MDYDISFENFDSSAFDIENWGDLCILSEKEEKDIRQLWEEIRI